MSKNCGLEYALQVLQASGNGLMMELKLMKVQHSGMVINQMTKAFFVVLMVGG